MVQDWPRDSVPRHQTYSQPRYSSDALDQRRYYDAPDQIRHQPPLAIDIALRTHCGIWAKQYFVAVIMDDGTPTTFFSPGQKLQDNVVCQFFDAKKFQHVATQLDSVPTQPLIESTGIDPNPYARPIYGNRYAGSDRRRIPAGDDGDETDGVAPRSGRKRPRARHDMDDDDIAPIPSIPMTCRKGIRVSDRAALWNFYDQRFKSCQQSACKLIAKAWVKAVEPKKQSTHPYTGSDEKAPDWWPKPWGMTKEDKVRHKEPDHLYKRERVHLLKHILDLVVQPIGTQHPDIQKLNLNVTKLEECTNEALSGFFGENPANASKKLYLQEIFKVARQQERYRNGEIDGTVEVYVLNDDRGIDHQASENDDASFSRDDNEQHVSPSVRSNATQSFVQTPTTGHSPATAPTGGAFVNDLPMRTSQQAPPQPMLHDMNNHHHQSLLEDGMSINGAPVNPGGTNIGVEILSHSHDTSRRPSIYGDYNNVGNSGLYTQHWQSVTAAPSTQPLYAHQQNTPAQSYVPTVPATHPQSYVNNSYVDAMPRHGYDPSQGQMFRPGDVSQAPVNQQQGYNYIPNDGRGMPALPGVSEVIDSGPRGHM